MNAQEEPAVTDSFSALDEALLGFGQKTYAGSIDLQRDTARYLATVAGVFFTAYFTILAFLGIESLKAAGGAIDLAIIALLPPVLLLVAIIVFVGISLPDIEWSSIDDLTVLQDLRDTRLRVRHRCMRYGLAVFVIALLLSIVAAFALLP